ncbi:protein kinase [Nonomuraea sp. NPDC000554]|uniref:protein kinase domain-containing protein n=1 Tax=Nonomuraea sp. NPDC000554 TaxID=3154259 RepID=UPI003324A366
MTAPERVRGYRLVERAGQDGPWTTYLAQDGGGGERVLLKTLACRRVDKRRLKWLARSFVFPAELAAHPGVVPVLDLGATGDGRPYLVTSAHAGLTLAERPGRGVPMPLDQALRVVRAVADVLAATHAAGGAHGYVRPENIVLPDGGAPVLTGFGMSGLMSLADLPDGTTPSVHVAPELLEGRPAAFASDVYSLASTLYELLTGRPPFPLDGPGTAARFTLAVLTEKPPPLGRPGIPRPIAETIEEALAKAPAARPSAAAFGERLAEQAAALPPTSTAPPGHPTLGLPAHPATTPSTPNSPTGLPGHPATTPAADSVVPGSLTGHPVGAPAGGMPPGDRLLVSSAAVEEPRRLVWTVDPDPPPTGWDGPAAPLAPAAPPQADADQPEDGKKADERGSGRKVPLLIAGISAAAVVIGVASVAVAVNGQLAGTRPVAQESSGTLSGDQGQSPDQGTDDGGQHSDRPTVADTPTAQPTTQTPSQPTTQTPSQPTAQPTAHPTATLRPARTADPRTLAAHRPKDLTMVADNGTTVTLAWKARRTSDYPMVLQQSPGARMMATAAGSTTYTIGGLDPATGYCFKVGTVVSLGRPSSVAWSPSLCIRGATEVDDEDQVQPPIVLPLATPPTS